VKTINPGFSSGIILGVICLLISLGLFIWAPGFSGFFDRGHDTQPVPIWAILLILAVMNFGYAFISRILLSRNHKENGELEENTQEAGRAKQD
jgi:TRAP-type C4-dicarboxylate transport system permease small subunit